MLPGVRPIISRASSPMAIILLVSRSIATTEGSFNTTPFPFIYTRMLAVPRSIPISVDIIENSIKKIPHFYQLHIKQGGINTCALACHIFIINNIVRFSKGFFSFYILKIFFTIRTYFSHNFHVLYK